MARRMYDLDNGTENIKVKEIVADTITGGASGGILLQVGDNLISLDGALYVEAEAGFYENVSMSKLLTIGRYTTAERPTEPFEGSIIYDSTLQKCILWNGTAWVNLDGTSLGE
jgi:hypothetical protein